MKNLILSTALLCSSLSYAATQTTQTLIPGAGQKEIFTGLSFTTAVVNVEGGGFSLESKSNGITVPFFFYYGIADGSAIGLETLYGNGKSESDSNFSGTTTTSTDKSSGLGDLLLNYKGNYDIGDPSLYFSAGYRFALETSKNEDRSATESESNLTSRQPALLLKAGIVHPVAEMKIGAILGYDYAFEGKEDSTSTTGTTTSYTVTKGGGTNLTVFAELENYFHPNFALNYSRTYSSESKATGSSIYRSGNETLGMTISGRMEVSPGFEFIPAFGYQTLLDKEVNGFEYTKYDFYTASFGARFSF